MTSRSPLQVSSTAQTLLSTSPVGQRDLAQHVLRDVGLAPSTRAWATRSTGPPPAPSSPAARAAAARARRGGVEGDDHVGRPAGPAPDAHVLGQLARASNPSGAPSSATRCPGLMPSLRGSGVPLYVVKLFGRALVTATNATSEAL